MNADADTGSLATFPGRDGLELVYRSIGEGRPFVLLHGFTGSGRQFLQHGLADALAGHGYRVIVPDLRVTATARGRTTPPPIRRTSWPTTASRLIAGNEQWQGPPATTSPFRPSGTPSTRSKMPPSC